MRAVWKWKGYGTGSTLQFSGCCTLFFRINGATAGFPISFLRFIIVPDGRYRSKSDRSDNLTKFSWKSWHNIPNNSVLLGGVSGFTVKTNENKNSRKGVDFIFHGLVFAIRIVFPSFVSYRRVFYDFVLFFLITLHKSYMEKNGVDKETQSYLGF